MTDRIYTIELMLGDDHEDGSIMAIIMRNSADEPEKFNVCDVREAHTVDRLRELVADIDGITHYRCYNANGAKADFRGGWSDALRVLKDKLLNKGLEIGADVNRRMSVANLVDAIKAQEYAISERERLDAERSDEIKRERLERETRVAFRGKNCAEFYERYRANRENFSKEEQAVARIAHEVQRVVDGWENVLEKFQKSVASNARHAMSWSGVFFEESARYAVFSDVASWIEAGATLKEIQETSLSNVMRNVSTNSRSTSTTSNLMDDCDQAAWKKIWEMSNSSWF